MAFPSKWVALGATSCAAGGLLVLVIAVWPNLCSGVIVAGTLGALCAASVAATVRIDSARAGFVGMAVFGWLHWGLSLSPWPAPQLATVQFADQICEVPVSTAAKKAARESGFDGDGSLLVYVHDQAHEVRIMALADPEAPFGEFQAYAKAEIPCAGHVVGVCVGTWLWGTIGYFTGNALSKAHPTRR
jgi:hypothetical protein